MKAIAFAELEKAGEEFILTLIADGTSVCAIAKQFNIHRPSVSAWLNKECRQERYFQARREAAGALAEEAMQIADEADPGNVQVARLRVDTRKWMAASLDPVFGQRGPSVEIHMTAGEAHLSALRKRVSTSMVIDAPTGAVGHGSTRADIEQEG